MRILKITAAVALTLVLFVVGGYFYNNYLNEHVKLTEYVYNNAKLPQEFDGYKLLVISDIHNADFGTQIVDLIEEAEPDAVFLTGDMVQLPDDNLENVLAIVEECVDKTPFYAVSGNHEQGNDSYWDIFDLLDSDGVKVMENKFEYIWRGDSKICLMGVADMDTAEDVLSDADISVIKKHINKMADKETFTVLACHRADIYPKIKDCPVDLILSGHLHGGIVRLPFVGGIVGKGGENFPKYDKGVFREGNAGMVVSAGCDKNPAKLRVFNQPELVLVTLKK